MAHILVQEVNTCILHSSRWKDLNIPLHSGKLLSKAVSSSIEKEETKISDKVFTWQWAVQRQPRWSYSLYSIISNAQLSRCCLQSCLRWCSKSSLLRTWSGSCWFASGGKRLPKTQSCGPRFVLKERAVTEETRFCWKWWAQDDLRQCRMFCFNIVMCLSGLVSMTHSYRSTSIKTPLMWYWRGFSTTKDWGKWA